MAEDETPAIPVNVQLNLTVLDNRSVGMQVKQVESIQHTSSDQSPVSNATTSLDGMQINQDASPRTLEKSPSVETPLIQQKAKLRQVFTAAQDKHPNNLMTEGNYDDAFEMLNRQLSVGYIGVYGEQLKQFHECLLRTKRPEQASKTRLELISLISENIETTPREIKEFADRLREATNYFDSILFYYVSAALHKKQPDADLTIDNIELCADGIQKSIESMLNIDENLKPVVKYHVIPLITDMTAMIINIEGSTSDKKCLYSNWCNHRKEYCEGLVGNFEAREHTIMESLDSMRLGLGEKVKEYQLFGHLLNNLGHTYWFTSRYKEAERHYELTIEAYKQAKDYSSVKLRDEDIDQAERNIKLTIEKINQST